MKYRTTKEHLAWFKEGCDHWLTQFGLTNWVCDFDIDKIDNEAQVIFFQKVSQAFFSLNRTMTVRPTQKRIKGVALHECLHLLLYTLCGLTEKNFRFRSERAVRILAKIICADKDIKWKV